MCSVILNKLYYDYLILHRVFDVNKNLFYLTIFIHVFICLYYIY